MFDKLFLYLSAAVQIQMKVDGCGLDVVMAQVVSDVCEAMAAQEHVDRPPGQSVGNMRVDPVVIPSRPLTTHTLTCLWVAEWISRALSLFRSIRR